MNDRHDIATDTGTPQPAAAIVEGVLEALRREWRLGGRVGMPMRFASAQVKRLRGYAATQQAADAVDAVDRLITAYESLPQTERKDGLTKIASALNAVRPLMPVTIDAPPIGKLPGAIAPGRAAVRPATVASRTPRNGVERPVPQLLVRAPVTDLPRVGPALAKKLRNLGIETVEDLLTSAPRRHIDYSHTEHIGSVLGFVPGQEVTVRGEVIDLREMRGAGPPRVVIKLADETGWVRVTWFNQYVARQMAIGDQIAISGKLDASFSRPSFTSPEWEKVGAAALSTGRLTPVYGLTQGVAQKTMRGLTSAALDATRSTISDFLPDRVRLEPNEAPLVPLRQAYTQAHYPDSYADLDLAQRRLAFDDLLLLQLGLVRRKRTRKAFNGIALDIDRAQLARFRAALPFSLTGSQDQALEEILSDLALSRPMTRLLQGDVGSGKTVVAAAALLVAQRNGYQGALMAPTEILAEQHFHNLRGLYAGLPDDERPSVALLTGSTRIAQRRETLVAAASGEIDILVGTHALIQGTIEFARLGLSVVDEQHRFGVRQRSELSNKGIGLEPHVLSMTATPIPRTLNLVLNGDLDVSIIAERPPGRVPIETRRYVGIDRGAAYDLVRTEVTHGHQVFVICPLVEASEASDAKAAVDEADRLQRDVFPDLRIAVLHGRMSGKEKDAVMTAFRDQETDVLVSTSVIEVGIDVPNATVMLIEGADRFGLAQLHQFRGRVGRGGAKSHCLLLAEEATPDGEARLQMMVDTGDGFLLAEKDLELRGPGDFIGTRQSGLPELSWIDGSFDSRLLDRARKAAETLLDLDPPLAAPEHAALSNRLATFWERASPDVPS